MALKNLSTNPTFKLSDPMPDGDQTEAVALNSSGNRRGMHNQKADKAIPRTFMVPAETIRMGVLLQTHCKPIKNEAGEDTKLWRYAKGWDDVRIAKETGERLDEGHTKRLRKSLEMKLEPILNSPKDKGIGSATYKMKFNAIDKSLGELFTRVDNCERGGQALLNRLAEVEPAQVTSISNRMQELVLKNSVLESVNEELVRTVHDLTHRFVQIEMTLSTLQLGNLEK